MYFLPQNHQPKLLIKPSPAYYDGKGTLTPLDRVSNCSEGR